MDNNDLSKKYPMVRITWEDIINFGRLSIEEIEEDMEDHRLFKKEIGFLIKRTDEYTVIVNDLDLTGGSDNYGSLIPNSVIVEIEHLEISDKQELDHDMEV